MSTKKLRVFATCHIGDPAENRLRQQGYDLEIYPGPEAPPKKLIVEKVRAGIDGLITTLRDAIDAEVFEAGEGTLKVVAQIAVGFDNINRADANRYKIPFTNTADVLTEATAEFAFFMMGMLARKMWGAEHLTRENQWGFWHPYLPFLGDEVTGKQHFALWLDWATNCGLAPIKNLARLVAAHSQGILNYFRQRITSATCEGLNNAIATLSKRAYGYRNLTNLRTALLFHLGGLDLYPALPVTHAIGR